VWKTIRSSFGAFTAPLKEGGQLPIAEIIPDDERQESLFPLRFAVNMPAVTPEDNTWDAEISTGQPLTSTVLFGHRNVAQAPRSTAEVFRVYTSL
jgi:hypothetical protein